MREDQYVPKPAQGIADQTYLVGLRKYGGERWGNESSRKIFRSTTPKKTLKQKKKKCETINLDVIFSIEINGEKYNINYNIFA